MAVRFCSQCDRALSKDSYSKNQWRKGDGQSRCYSCVHPGSRAANKQNPSFDATQTARTNNATKASFESYDLDHPFAQGSFRWVAKGVYTVGNRAGEACVCKWFKTGGVLEDSFFDTDLRTVEKAVQLITQWNNMRFIDKIVRINQPSVWTFDPFGRRDFAGKKVLQEPYIENYQKFNSNTGWADDSLPWPRVMQAVSHYSYHASAGTKILCDLQGGIYSDGVCLTDPVVISLFRGSYGPTDLGLKGMHTFFANHTCNEFCRLNWLKISDPRRFHTPHKGTTMEHVATERSRPRMTGGIGAIFE